MAAHQAPPSLRFSRQEHWSGLPFPSPMHESEKWKWSRSILSHKKEHIRVSFNKVDDNKVDNYIEWSKSEKKNQILYINTYIWNLEGWYSWTCLQSSIGDADISNKHGQAWASFVAQLVKNPPAMRETWVWSLGWEDPLEKAKATHSSILAWRIPWAVQTMGSQRVEHDWVTFTSHGQ